MLCETKKSVEMTELYKGGGDSGVTVILVVVALVFLSWVLRTVGNQCRLHSVLALPLQPKRYRCIALCIIT